MKEMLEETSSSWKQKICDVSGPTDSQHRTNHKARDSWLTEELGKINEEEGEANKKTMAEEETANQQFEHYIRFPQEDFDVTDELIEDQASILFENAPIKFKPRKGKKIDLEI